MNHTNQEIFCINPNKQVESDFSFKINKLIWAGFEIFGRGDWSPGIFFFLTSNGFGGWIDMNRADDCKSWKRIKIFQNASTIYLSKCSFKNVNIQF